MAFPHHKQRSTRSLGERKILAKRRSFWVRPRVLHSRSSHTHNESLRLRMWNSGSHSKAPSFCLKKSWHWNNNTDVIRSSKVLRADGRLVNMSGVFCTNNAQAPSLFSNVTLTSRRSYVETVSGNSALLQSNGIPFDWRRALSAC